MKKLIDKIHILIQKSLSKEKVLKKKEVPLYELYYCNIKKNITFKDILIYKLYKLYSFLK